MRDDTVRCVISSLTEDEPSELADELVRGEALQLDEGSASDEETEGWETWNPDPVDADPSKRISCFIIVNQIYSIHFYML